MQRRFCVMSWETNLRGLSTKGPTRCWPWSIGCINASSFLSLFLLKECWSLCLRASRPRRLYHVARLWWVLSGSSVSWCSLRILTLSSMTLSFGRSKRLEGLQTDLHEARPSKLEEVKNKKMERFMLSEASDKDRYLMGAALFALYSRSRWLDLAMVEYAKSRGDPLVSLSRNPCKCHWWVQSSELLM